MKTELTLKNIQKTPGLQVYFNERLNKIEKLLIKFKDDLTFLHTTLEKNPHKDEYFCSLTLYLPTSSLHCRKRSVEEFVAVNLAFQDLMRLVKKHKAKLGKEKIRKNKEWRKSTKM